MGFLGKKTATLIIMFLTFLGVTRGSHPIFQQTYDLWKNHQFHPNCGYRLSCAKSSSEHPCFHL